MATVKINGTAVDIDDPCAMASALRAVRLKRIAGEAVEESEIQSPVGKRRIKLATTSISDLEQEIARLETACAVKNGTRRVGRRWSLRF
ncbi:hypothetical protein [Martelella sp. HB161492]|uniref:hypothetical protein n=1 Tax=Martelella sp. HB161492 TaxID=2720726 RepID=UPI00159298FA|nr:hypothetical protein [Martelella sp. HB161492]